MSDYINDDIVVTAMEVEGVWYIMPDQYFLLDVGTGSVPTIFIDTAGVQELEVIFKQESQVRVWWDAVINEEQRYGVLLLNLQFQNSEQSHVVIAFDDFDEQSALAHKLQRIEYLLLARYSERDNKIIIPLDKSELLAALQQFP